MCPIAKIVQVYICEYHGQLNDSSQKMFFGASDKQRITAHLLNVEQKVR